MNLSIEPFNDQLRNFRINKNFNMTLQKEILTLLVIKVKVKRLFMLFRFN